MIATENPPLAAEIPPLGTPDAPSGEAVVSTPAADEQGDGSLAAHEASVTRADPEHGDDTRDEGGRFKSRRRAASQQADADDVPVINELTKRLKTIEETHGKDIARKPGESERVYQLRRRAELLERITAAPAAQPAQTPAPVSQQVPRQQGTALPQSFPTYEQFLGIEGNAEATYEDYVDARADWRFARGRAAERAQEAQERESRTVAERIAAHQSRLTTAKTKYPDWDAVVTTDLPVTRVIADAVLASESSTDVQYYLGSHRDVLAALVSESQDYSPSAVAAMRRYLDSLVAASQRTSPSQRASAGSTGAATTTLPPPAPRPPTPVRTSATTPTDDPPGDDSQSLAAHEKAYGRARR